MECEQLKLLEQLAALHPTLVYVSGNPCKRVDIPNDLWVKLEKIPKEKLQIKCAGCEKDLVVKKILCDDCDTGPTY